jgi:acetaldehyde dehydrogenase/alcohol dehydrogenase
MPNLFSQMTAADAAVFATYVKPVTFAADTVIFRQGDEPNACYLVETGRVRIELSGDHVDSDNVLGYVSAGSVFGELALLDGQPRSATAVAQTEVVTRQLKATDLTELAAAHPLVAANFFATLGREAATKLRSANQRLAEILIQGTDEEVEALTRRAREVGPRLAALNEEAIDRVIQAVIDLCVARAAEWAQLTVEITRYGNAEDKRRKNLIASAGVGRHLLGRRGSGVVGEDATLQVTEIAAPVGTVFGLIPVTNPVATAIFKTLICLKSRNPLILSFHRSTKQLGAAICEPLRDTIAAAGGPADALQYVKDRNSRKKTEMFFTHPGIAMILATGGSSMVKAAYSSGKPAIGVGAGNAPVLVAPDADLIHAAGSVVASKSFDHGLICGSEHNLVVPAAILPAFIQCLEGAGAAVLNAEELGRFRAYALDETGTSLRGRLVGASAASIAAGCNVTRDHPIHVIVAPGGEPAPDNALSREKMCPVIGLFEVPDVETGIARCLEILAIEGRGHTAVIHTRDNTLAARFGALMPASRILVNSPATHGVIGFTTGLIPSLTLGCGTFGGNSTTDNVTFTHLLNIKRLARFVGPRYDF